MCLSSSLCTTTGCGVGLMPQNVRVESTTALVTMGSQAQVVTFALDVLFALGERIKTAMVLHLSPEGPRVRNALPQLSAEFAGEQYRGRPLTLRHLPVQVGNQPLSAIRSARDAEDVWQFACDLLSVSPCSADDGATRCVISVTSRSCRQRAPRCCVGAACQPPARGSARTSRRIITPRGCRTTLHHAQDPGYTQDRDFRRVPQRVGPARRRAANVPLSAREVRSLDRIRETAHAWSRLCLFHGRLRARKAHQRNL
jgi:hypothetical protein